jgi:hypothetical protein
LIILCARCRYPENRTIWRFFFVLSSVLAFVNLIKREIV